MGEMLCSDVPGSMRGWAIFRGEPFLWNSWGAILHSVRTGDSAFAHVHGKSGFEYFEHNPEAGRIFNEAMGAITGQTARALLDAYDFSGVKMLVDVGGGTGALLREILKEHAGMSGILADQSHVVAKSVEYLSSCGVARSVPRIAPPSFAVPLSMVLRAGCFTVIVPSFTMVEWLQQDCSQKTDFPLLRLGESP